MEIERFQPLWHEANIELDAHVISIRRTARKIAHDAGFSKSRAEDIVLCVSELAQNHISHKTKSGKIRIFAQRFLNGIKVFNLSSLDSGPGIKWLRQMVIRPYNSLTGSLGAGLNCVKRLSNEFAICSGKIGVLPCPDFLLNKKEVATLVSAFFCEPSSYVSGLPINFAYLIRPSGENRYCGDGVSFSFLDPFFKIVVIDALGSGKEAALVTFRAKEIIEALPADLPPDKLLYQVGRELLGTRGAMAIATRINVKEGQVDIASVGDVSQALYLDGKSDFVTGKSGTLGAINTRNAFLKKSFSGFNEIMGIIFTDGIKSVPKLKFKQSTGDWSALLWVNYLFSICNNSFNQEDDASIIVWKWKK